MKKFYLENYGCQMNKADSTSLTCTLTNEGLIHTLNYKDADFIIINTCSVRQHAEERVFGRIRHFNAFKKKYSTSLEILIMGCMAQTSKMKLYSLGVSAIFDVYNEWAIINYLINGMLEQTEFNSEYIFHKPYIDASYPHKAYLPISHGCDNWCTYCIVPHTRGRMISRDMSEIIEALKSLIEQGAKEITLLGQNVNAYGSDNNGATFSDLLYEIDKTIASSKVWVRFMTSHPRDFDRKTAEAILTLSSVCNHLHLPFQSGSDRILEIMKRGYTRQEYLEKINYLRTIDNEFAISTDVLVGFADESDSDFEDTIDLLESAQFEAAYLYRYSEREGSIAYKNKILYDEEKGKERLSRLIDYQRSMASNILQKQIGKTLNVMVDGIAKDSKHYLCKSYENRTVLLEMKEGITLSPGEQYMVTIIGIKNYSLYGEIVA